MNPANLNPAELRAFVRRDWNCLVQPDRIARAAQPTEQKMRIAAALYEAARQTLPGWPRASDRCADFDHHLAVQAIYARITHVRPG